MSEGRPKAKPTINYSQLETLIKDGINEYLFEYILEGYIKERGSIIKATNETYRRIEECAEGIVKQWRREFND